MKYKIKFRKPGAWFWRTRTVTGSKIEPNGRMIFFYEDGGIEELANFTQYDARLGVDWLLATKSAMEKESGQTLKVNQE